MPGPGGVGHDRAGRRPAHALGPRVVPALPALPAPAGDGPGRAAGPARRRPAAPASPSTGRPRRSTTTWRSGRSRTAWSGELVAQGGWRSGRGGCWPTRSCAPGENLVRNLEIGHAPRRRPRRRHAVGYLPDQFGHAAQLPQILRHGRNRGTHASGAACRRRWRTTPFRWVAPDGTAHADASTCPRADYGGAAGAVRRPGPAAVAARAAEHVRALREWQPDGALLGMYGTDHSAPVEGLPGMVRGARARFAAREERDGTVQTDHRGELSERSTSLAGLADGPTACSDGRSTPRRLTRPPRGLPGVHGELRSHARAEHPARRPVLARSH